jgi:hypothetical protein
MKKFCVVNASVGKLPNGLSWSLPEGSQHGRSGAIVGQLALLKRSNRLHSRLSATFFLHLNGTEVEEFVNNPPESTAAQARRIEPF